MDSLELQTDESNHAVSVAELTGHIKAILEGTFPSIWVSGEVSDVVNARSGHVYFTFKDADAQIRGVIWRSTASRMKEPLQDGQSVLCFGDVEVYALRGTYQMVVRKVQTQGLGPLQQKFEKQRIALHAEGLFDAERKRELPTFPKRIAVITSPTGAAVRDFLQAASTRFAGAQMIVIPALVQGAGSVKSIVDAIRSAHKVRPTVDTLVLTRGGGSLEDLWSFNEEAVVRAVAKSRIPTVSAVGHEIDITLCDLAADVRALTPTDAASRVLPDGKRLQAEIADLRHRMGHVGRQMILTRKQTLEQLSSLVAFRKPHEMVHLRSRLLDDLDGRANRAVRSRLELGQATMAKLAASLTALSPLKVLARGYSVTTDESGRAITDAEQVKAGDLIRTRFDCGEVTSTVAPR